MLLKINTGICALAVLAGVYGYVEYRRLPPGVNPDETLLPSDISNAGIGLVQVLFSIFLAVTFLRWIYRANRNLHQLGGVPMAFSPGWSVGWYFVPVANLYKPYQAMKEIWIVAHRGELGSGNILGWWWFLWIVSTFVDRIAMRLALHAQGVVDYTNSALAYVVSDGIDVVLNVVALMLVRSIADAYSKNYVETDAPLGGGPAREAADALPSRSGAGPSC
ncbi:MAG TPA: DUF4328 domain-containing protein [Candidatus Acidoferrum sp.]|nr:DUF4328 domain-containing protein [Candidatus Acidoferrum sp.]